MNNLLCVIILKILIFLRFFPGSLFLKNFQLLLSSFFINLKMAKSIVHRPYFEVPTETKNNHQLINNKKMKLCLLDIYIHSPYQNHKRGKKNSKENLSSEIGTSRIKVTVVNIALIFLFILCCVAYKCRCNSSCSFLATDSQRDALADKAQAYLFP